MKYISFESKNCKDCYSCLRNCPVKTIKFVNNKATILDENCILCGRCVNVCPQDAKRVISDINEVLKLLNDSTLKVALSVAPSFISSFDVKSFASFKNACLKLGFDIVEETAIGAAVVTNEYEKIFENNENKTFISTACPSAVDYVRMTYPEAIKFLLPVTSPMVAHAKLLKKQDNNLKIVFVGPCIAKKKEAYESKLVDYVLTFEDLRKMFETNGISFDNEFDNEDTQLKARYYPINRGVFKSILKDNNKDYISIDGYEEIDDILKNIENFENAFIEMNMCKGGCINGPAKTSTKNVMLDNIIVKRYAKSKGKDIKVDFDVNISKSFTPLTKNFKIPTEEQLTEVLHKLNKFSKEDEINCGACGYNTCREKAVAIFNGLSDLEYCMPYLKNKAESISNEIIKHTPNGIVTVNKKGQIIEINDRACKYLCVDKSIVGSFYQQYIDLPELIVCIENQKNLKSLIYYNEKNDKYFDVSITVVKEHDYAFAIYKDVTEITLSDEKMKKLRKEMIKVTDEVINEQMRAVQEIASLLGESTAKAKVALVNFKNTLKDE